MLLSFGAQAFRARAFTPIFGTFSTDGIVEGYLLFLGNSAITMLTEGYSSMIYINVPYNLFSPITTAFDFNSALNMELPQ